MTLIIVLSMPTLDVAMPIALLLVVTVAMLLNKRVEGKLMATVEEKEFKTRDILLLVVFMAIIISAIAYTSMVNPGAVFENILLLFFLSSYTMLLFTISYVFSTVPETMIQLLSVGFGIASAVTGDICLFPQLQDSFTIFRVAAFFALAAFCFAVPFYEPRKNVITKARWYMAVQPSAIFVLLFVFFNFISNSGTAAIWAPYLMDVFGLTFAILIILYLSSLFTWKVAGLFAVLLTAWDIFSVIGTPIMLTAAHTFSGLGLPVLVYLPNIPIQIAHLANSGMPYLVYRGLGLGDFFFAGVLTIQTFKKFGQRTAFIAVIAIAVAFGIWDAFLLDIINWFIPIVGRNIGGLPATMFIISGWAPVVAWKILSDRNKKLTQQPVAEQPGKENVALSNDLIK